MQEEMLQLPTVNLQEPAAALTQGGVTYKPSRFNHFHTLPTGEKLAFNSLSSAGRIAARMGSSKRQGLGLLS